MISILLHNSLLHAKITGNKVTNNPISTHNSLSNEETDPVTSNEKPDSGIIRCTVNDLKFVLNDRDNCLFAVDRWIEIMGVRLRRGKTWRANDKLVPLMRRKYLGD